MRSRWRNRHRHEPAELNITSFMNLMVILVPFLLITAVFSRMAILELNLPTSNSGEAQEEPEFALEVIVRKTEIQVGDRNAGVFTIIPRNESGSEEYQVLTEKLKDVKANFPDQLGVTLLLEPQVDYEVVVKVMDAVRSYRIEEPGDFSRAELFPEISIGDAPVLVEG
ncbi:MAG: ExbD/TolR family protein [Gammaproteobacteria bacterium]